MAPWRNKPGATLLIPVSRLIPRGFKLWFDL